MFTFDPQLIHSVINSVALLAIAGVLGVVVKLVRKIHGERPSESLVMELRAEVERFSGMVADLENRFSRFQKREGMRHARESKATQSDLLAEASGIVANSGGPDASRAGTKGTDKVELYRRARGLNS